MSMTVGRTEESWRKEEVLEKTAGALIGTASKKLPGRGIIIDFHAGDAKGVIHPQGDLFRVNEATTTPAISDRLSRLHPVGVLLCEKVKSRRLTLCERFPQNEVMGDHAMAYDRVLAMQERPRWGVLFSDPNGHGSLGIEHMARCGRLIPCLDFVIVYPQGSLMRCIGVRDSTLRQGKGIDDLNRIGQSAYTSAEKSEWTLGDRLDQWKDRLPSLEWLTRLGRKHMAATRVIDASFGFRYRILVVSNYLPQGILRNQLFQVVK